LHVASRRRATGASSHVDTFAGFEEIGMTGPPDFKELVAVALDRRKSVQQRNIAARDDITAALLAAHDEHTPWKAVPPSEEIVANVTKRLHVSCEDTFRLSLILVDGGRVVFPAVEAGDPFSAANSAEALHEIARRFALHRLLDEATVVRRTMQAR
jgi:hypothetical protein